MPSYQAARREIIAGCYHPAYLLYGEEQLLKDELLQLLSSRYLGQSSGYGLRKTDGAACSLEELISEREPSLFASRRLLVINNPPYLEAPREGPLGQEQSSSAPKGRFAETESAVNLLERFIERGQRLPLPEEIIVFVSPRVDKRRRIFKLLERKGAVVECSPLKGEALRRWINERVELAGKKIDPQALELIIFSGESDLWRLQHEVEKFAAYLEGDQEMITAPVVELLLSGERHGNVFNLVDALGEGDRGAALERLQQLLRRREPPLKIFFMIARHFRLLLETRLLQEEQAGQPDYAAELKLPPFVAQKLRQQARSYSSGLLQEVIILLQQEDHKIKTGRADPELALEMIVAGIGRLAAGRGSAT